MAPKKAAKKHAPPAGKDLRRAYEHLGRVQKLIPLITEQDNTAVVGLVHFARELVRQGPPKEAADLLRAAEHLAFACVRTVHDESPLSRELVDGIKEEFEHLMVDAEEHWDEEDRAEVVERTYTHMHKAAAARMKEKQYREALELARGAEALTHVHAHPFTPLAASSGKRLPTRG
jgi:hypothetical protein